MVIWAFFLVLPLYAFHFLKLLRFKLVVLGSSFNCVKQCLKIKLDDSGVKSLTHMFQVQVQVDAQAEPQAQVFSLSLISMLTSNFEFNLKFYLIFWRKLFKFS